jgi:hypothetical protein
MTPSTASETPAQAQGAAPLVRIGLACGLGTLAFLYYARAFHNLWFATGPYLFDFGWFNVLIDGTRFDLHNPTSVGDYSYAAIHVAPVLILFSALSRLLGLTDGQPIILMLSLGFAGATAMAFVVLERFLRPLGALPALGGGAVGAAVYAVSGVMRSTADYPHIEILYVPLALLTLHLLFQGRTRAAWAALAACLITREDAGLHLACILGAYLVLAALEERGAPARLGALAGPLAACLIYPALAILWQRTAYPDASTFAQIYAGTPPFRHLTPHLITERLRALAGVRAWLGLTLLSAASGLVWLPRWTALTGLVAAAPWFCLNLVAKSEAAGGLMLYYGFPFLVTALAPFIVLAARPARRLTREDRLDVVAL